MNLLQHHADTLPAGTGGKARTTLCIREGGVTPVLPSTRAKIPLPSAGAFLPQTRRLLPTKEKQSLSHLPPCCTGCYGLLRENQVATTVVRKPWQLVFPNRKNHPSPELELSVWSNSSERTGQDPSMPPWPLALHGAGGKPCSRSQEATY